ncbi:MAG: hypothetical protein L6461_13665 [Anaerolineae bacterium]|nr:hypothetical protein [Anaerolineae bacterium]
MTTEKSKLLFLVLILLGVSWLVGCGAQPAARPTAVQLSPTVASPSTITPTATLAGFPTETASVEPSPTALPYTRCQEIIDAQLPKDFLTEGSIIFDGECEGREGLFRLSADTHKIEPFLGDFVRRQYNYGVRLSPDRQWLAVDVPVYDEDDGFYLYDSLIITGENEKNFIRYSGNRVWGIEDDSHFDKEWVDSQKMQISLWRAGVSQVLLDVFNGKMSFLEVPGNNFYDSDNTYYSPDLTSLLTFNRGSVSYSLFNLETGQELWRSEENLMQQTYRYQSTMDSHLWSPDSRLVAFPVWDDEQSDGENSSFVFRFMVITRDGREILSQPVQSFGYILYTDQKPEVPFGWSQDSQYLIYWNPGESGTNQLIYWNPLTNEFLDPGFTIYDNYARYPHFSPDGQKFILQAKMSSADNAEYSNYLVNISTGKTAQLDINLVPLAWMKTNQEIAKQEPEPFPLPPRKNAGVSQICLNQNTSETLKTSGALIFSQLGYLYRFASTTGITKIAEADNRYGSGYMDGDVSPNRKWLVYWYWDYEVGNRYWLYTLDGMPEEILKNNKIHDISRWRSNDEIWILNFDLYESRLFNPFTQKFRERPDFATQETWDKLPGCGYGSQCKVDSAGYQPYDDAIELWIDAYASGYTLIDRKEKFLWEYENPLAGFNLPKWQPGDQKLAIPMPVNEQDVLGEHYEIFTVNRSGRQRQLTNYLAAYPTMSIDKFSWSPDGRYIAFWGDTHSKEKIAQQHPYRLFVLDTVTYQTVDYCVPGGYVSQYSHTSIYSDNPAPIWSADGRHIAVNGILDDKRMIMLVDFASGTVSPVAEGELIGWMAEP